MDPERWRRVETLFHRALALDAALRATWLANECGDDAELRDQVERLLADDARPHELVDRLDGGALRPREDPLVGREIGSYRLTSRIAVGGMGVVYRAERTDGAFQREVAVKLIRIELASESLVRRFEFERRTLAALHHPHIAQLHDGGTTADGRPYLVMELVRGVPIDRYCEERQLSIDARLRLFVQVCRAVHFAHQNLVVHRDLKPGNILVDEHGVPKLLDFGIARLLDESGAVPLTGATLTGAALLTPDYASPEQLTQGPVTTSMDVYSLGVVLYELLTGRRPFQSDGRKPLDWQRAVLERPPTRPSSTSLWSNTLPAAGPVGEPQPAELAAARGCTPRSLRRRLRGDLDRIVLMALRKEPERRYSSARDLADDIERHFSGHPLQARPDSLAYRATRFVRRNRLAVASAVAVLVALVFGVVSARRGEERAQAQAMHARIEAQSFQGIAEFLMETFLASTSELSPEQLAQRRERIQTHAALLRRLYGDQDHLRANLLDSLGHVAERLGLVEDAFALVQEALEIRARDFGETSLEYALSLRSLGLLRYGKGELAPAAELFERALAVHRARAGETHTDVALVANDLAACWRGLGRLDAAEALHREALTLRRADGDGSLTVAESLNNLAGIALDRNDLPAAVKLLEEALDIRRRILGDDAPLTLQSMSNLAMTLWRSGERERCDALLLDTERGFRALHVDGEEELAHVLSNHAAMRIAERKYEQAEPLLAEALELQLRRSGPLHPSVATTLARQAQLLQALKRPEEARASWQRVLEIRRAPDASPRYLGQALSEYGAFLWQTHANDEARAALREAVEVLRSSGSARTPLLARAQLAYGEVLLASDDAASARAELEEALAIFEATPAGNEEELARARATLKRCEAAAGPR